jgi:bifunctional DNase/RNase
MTTATEVGYVEMRIAKVVGLATAEDEPFHYVVLEEVAGDRQLAIAIGHAEAFSLAARLGGIAWPRPMTYQFVAALVRALGGRVLKVRIDRVVEETYIGAVEVEGPPGVQAVDARPSDALNRWRWCRHRSSSPPRSCKTRRPDARGIPLKRHACVGRRQLHR